jgi:hypothetical protein
LRVLFFSGLLDESDSNLTEDYFPYKFNHDKRIYILHSLVWCIDNEKQYYIKFIIEDENSYMKIDNIYIKKVEKSQTTPWYNNVFGGKKKRIQSKKFFPFHNPLMIEETKS